MLNVLKAPEIPRWCQSHGTKKEKIPPRLAAHKRFLPLLIGITVYSGICLVLNLNSPIFALERDFIKDKVEENIEIQKEIYLSQYWQQEIKEKYKNNAITFPTKGVAHIKTTKTINGKQIKINIVEINPEVNKNLVIKPEIPSSTLNSKAQISKIANKNNAIVAINGGFFKPQTGVSLGTLMIDNKMLTGPIYNRVGIGIEQNELGTFFEMGRINLDISLKNSLVTFKLDNINQPRMLSTYKLIYTPEWGEYSPLPPKYGVNAVIKDGQIVSVSKERVQIPHDGYVLSAPNEKVAQLIGYKNLKLDIKLPQKFENSNHIISGGPYLVKNGEMYVDINEEKLNAIGGRNPRSAIGYDKKGRLIIVTVDGREENSVGMTLNQLSALMKSLGCHNAMNFDGGGSTVMYIQGKITNSPAQKGGIAISNALTISEKN